MKTLHLKQTGYAFWGNESSNEFSGYLLGADGRPRTFTVEEARAIASEENAGLDMEADSMPSNALKTIKAGDTLTARSICDYDCIYKVQIIARKGQWVTVQVEHEKETKRCKVKAFSDGEYIMAMGRYSMAPIFRAV